MKASCDTSLIAFCAVVGAFVLAGLVACAPVGPLLEVDGPIEVTARNVEARGVDTAPAVYRVRIHNKLRADEGICEITVRKKSDSVWSSNQIVRPDTCYYQNDAVPVILLPSGGDWVVRVKTSTRRIEKITLRITAATTETKVGG